MASLPAIRSRSAIRVQRIRDVAFATGLGNRFFTPDARHQRLQLELCAVLAAIFAHRAFLSQPLLYYLQVVSRNSTQLKNSGRRCPQYSRTPIAEITNIKRGSRSPG